MLPTKGYFQDIECPYFNSSCGRPYCHFRHKKKLSETVEDVSEPEKEDSNSVPTYKPTPKSQLASIQKQSHIPISYVPDLSFRPTSTLRPAPKIEKPVYKPTPLSILSYANRRGSEENGDPHREHIVEAIKELKQKVADSEYNPVSTFSSAGDINFEELNNEFDLIDEIISADENAKNEGEQEQGTSDILSGINKEIDKLHQDIQEIKAAEISDDPNLESEAKNDKEPEESPDKKIVFTEKHADEDKKKERGDSSKKSKSSRERSPEKTEKRHSHSSKDKEKGNKDKKLEKDKSEKLEKNKVSEKLKQETFKEGKDKKIDKGKHDKSEKSSKDKKIEKSDKSKSHKSSSREKHRKEEHNDRNEVDPERGSKPSEKKKHKTKERSRSRSESQENSKERRKSKESEKEKIRHKSKEKSRSRSRSSSKEKSKSKHSEKNKNKHKKTRAKSESKSRSRSNSKEKSRSKDAGKATKSKHKIRQKSRSTSRSSSSSKERCKDNDSEKHKPRHKNKEKSRSRSKERNHTSGTSKERRKSKDSSDKDKDRKHSKSKHKNSHRDKDKTHRSSDRKEKVRKTTESSNDGSDIDKSHQHPPDKKVKKKRIMNEDCSTSEDERDMPMSFDESLLDLDLDDEDETMLECYRIFNEYNPEPVHREQFPTTSGQPSVEVREQDDVKEYVGKKRIAHLNAEKSVNFMQPPPPTKVNHATPGLMLTNRYKLAKQAQANREQELLMNEVEQQAISVKRPAQTLLEAARERKLLRLANAQVKTPNTNIVDEILKGTSKVIPAPQVKVQKKIAPAQNVMLIQKAKERISKIKQVTPVKTVAQTQKGGRVAHVPDVSLSDIPDVLQADKSKLPVNVRTRFLTMIADECVKLYISKEEAFARALNEEYACYEKCKVLATYRNSAMLAVNRLRKEIQERERSGLGLIGLGEDPNSGNSDAAGEKFYNAVKKWVLTEEELDIHGYPRESEQHHGKAVIRNFKSNLPCNLDDNQRICARCHKLYQVDDDGWPLFEEECLYHPLRKRTIRGEQTYLCCRSNDDSGCATSDTHVSDGVMSGELEGFQTTLEPESDDDRRSHAVYALDCEMCYTTKGLELTRVTIVDVDCKTVYESLVKPLNPIIDYNTRFSGITKDQMDRTSTNLLQIQANILHLCNSSTILVGHSLESDMKALKIVHSNIIDTAVLFPHKMGLPHKRALKALASEYLRKIIQNDVSGHDSAEDAITCMELLKWKLKEESRGKK